MNFPFSLPNFRSNPDFRLRPSFRGRLPRLVASALAVCLLPLTACAPFGPKLRAKFVDHVPAPNRLIEVNSLWKDVKPLHVRLQSAIDPSRKKDVVLRAVHDGQAISIFAHWLDDTRSDAESRAWVWSLRSEAYFLQESPNDMFAMQFSIAGSPDACMMSGKEGVYDVWQWRSGWNRVFGYAEDRKLTISRTAPPDWAEAQMYRTRGGGPPIYFHWEEDIGRAPYRYVDLPRERAGHLVPGIRARSPTESAANVLAEVVQDPSGYALELKRALVTDFDDDYQMIGPGPHWFAVAVTDDDQGQAHFTSELIQLYLE